MNLRHWNENPIGVFDSGLGGLTVMRELMQLLPAENIVYFGDTARVPYGTKSKESIIQFSKENAEVLLKYKVKMIVVACNSSSSYALHELKTAFDVPIVGVIEPGAQKAVSVTKNQKVGVVATSATVASGSYEKAIQKKMAKVKVFSQACPLFVPLIEEGWFDKKVTLDVAKEYLESLKTADVDTLILGCTHYPLIKNVLQKVMGKSVELIDSAEVVAEEVKRVLIRQKGLRGSTKKGKHEFFVSDKPQEFKRIATSFLGEAMKHSQVIKKRNF